MLKKEFKRKDVDRARNLLMGKSGASSETQVGYKKKRIEYKEGDVWKENGKTWTIKDGIKQTISKLDAIKKEVFMPLCCPKCGKVMKCQLDKPNYKFHKMCFNCVVDYEANQSNEGFISEQGEVERWKGGVNINKITSDITQAAQKAREDIQKQLINEKN